MLSVGQVHVIRHKVLMDRASQRRVARKMGLSDPGASGARRPARLTAVLAAMDAAAILAARGRRAFASMASK